MSKRKEEILLNLRLLEQPIRLGDRGLLASLNCITYEKSCSGNFLFKHAQGTHGDLAYALASWAAKNGEGGTVIIGRDRVKTSELQNFHLATEVKQYKT